MKQELTYNRYRNNAYILFIAVALLCSCGGKVSDKKFVNPQLIEMDADTITQSLPNVFVSDRDTNQYKQCLYRLKELVDSNITIPAKVLCEAAPRSDEEYHICYDLTECKWIIVRENYNASLIDMDYLLYRYAVADSAGVMEAYMLFGEFVDGYVAESTFDKYIELEGMYPSKFSELRKQRSERWNSIYDEWKIISENDYLMPDSGDVLDI